MERSREVEALVRKMYELMRAGDGEALGALLGEQPGTLVIGTDADEWWDSAAIARAAIKAQFDAADGFDILDGEIHAYASGDVAWFDDQPTLRLPDGTELPMRVTGVAQRTADGWALHQIHNSVAASINALLLG